MLKHKAVSSRLMAINRFLDRPSRCIWPLDQPNGYASKQAVLTLIQRPRDKLHSA